MWAWKRCAADNQRLPAVICVMAGNRTMVALEVDGEETLMLQSDAPGVLLGRGGHSSTFLRKYLTDATISREHVRVQAIADNDDGGGDGGSERDTAAAPSRVRVSVVGSNPVLLVRRKPPGGTSYIHRGQSAVAEVGDGFRFCRGFDKVVRVVTVPQPPPPPLGSSRQERAGSREEGNSGDDGERARDPAPSSSAARGVGGGAREDGNKPDGGLAGGAAIAERERRGGGESESGVRLGAGQASAAATAAAAGASRCAAEGAAASVAPAAPVVISAVKASAGTGERGASPEKPATDSDNAGSDGPSRDSGQSTTERRTGGDADGDGARGKLAGDQGKRSVQGRDENSAGRSDDGEEAGKLNHEEEDGSGGASGFAVTAGNVWEGGGARETHAPMQEEEEEEEEGDSNDRQDGGGRRLRGEREHYQRRRRQRQGVGKQGDGAQGSPPPPPLVAASTETALASRRRDGVASSSPAAAAAAAAAAATLRVALVGRGFSKNQQEVFRKNGSKLGMEVLVRPEAKVGKPPNLFEATPGATPGKGKKRRRSSGNERHHRMSQPPPPPPPPPPPSPPRQFVAGGGGGSGGRGLLELLRRERFAVAVCWSEELAPWVELLGPTAAEGGGEVPPPVGAGMVLGGGGGREAGGGDVEVVGHQWLVSCLQQNRRVDTRPYLLSPLKKDDVVGAEEDGEEEGGREPAFVVPMYACQRPTPMKHHNHEITDVLDAMTKMYKVVGDGQRADSFMRLSSVLRFLDRRIRSGSEIRHVHHVGERMVEAVDEILATGTLGRLEELKSHPRNQVCQQLMKVHGVGSKTAKDWYNRGIRSVEDARRTLLPNNDDTEGDDKRPNLKPEVVMGLKHFHDMQVPIGRDEVVGIADEVREEAERFGRERDPEGTLLFEVCGGFRRGKETLHDVDVLVSFCRGNGEPGHQGFVEGLKERLMERGKLCATLYQGQMGGFTKAKGGQAPQPKLEREEVLMALWQLPGRKCRIDIVQVASPQWPFALLGWSGTVMFEKDVRRYTEEQTEYKLSQKGVTIRATDEPVTDIVSFQTEEDIFRFLGLEYIPPHLRWV